MNRPAPRTVRRRFFVALGRALRLAWPILSMIFAIQVALGGTLPKIDNDARRRYVALDLNRLDGLLETFYKRAIEKVDTQAALCVVKILERRALLLGLDSPQKLDIVQVQAEKQPTQHERIRAALMSLKYGPNGRPNGDGAVPSDLDPVPPSDDPKSSH
jgi:hypothetical protein